MSIEEAVSYHERVLGKHAGEIDELREAVRSLEQAGEINKRADQLADENPLTPSGQYLAVTGLTDTEKRLVMMVRDRLIWGHSLYGDFDLYSGRDWSTEAAEELADALVYTAARALQIEEA